MRGVVGINAKRETVHKDCLPGICMPPKVATVCDMPAAAYYWCYAASAY